MLPTMAERVATGAGLLDKVRPGWARQISIPAMDMGDVGFCVLGQIFGDYTTGRVTLGLSKKDTIAHGLLLTYAGMPGEEQYSELAALWHQQIKRRRGLRAFGHFILPAG